MSSNVRIAFEERIEKLPLSQLLPLNPVSPELKQSAKYKQISRSVAEVGIIEPLVVARSPDQPHHYLLLDGHLRHAVLTDAGEIDARCLIAQPLALTPDNSSQRFGTARADDRRIQGNRHIGSQPPPG